MEEYAAACYQKMMDLLFEHSNNPTFELCDLTIENLFGKAGLVALKFCGYIRYVGKNHNGRSVYQVR